MTTYYYLYQITNLINNKIYVGVHKTKSLSDGYMGSGKIIGNAIVKHGISNFSKDILEFFDTSEAMYAREKEVVTDEFLLREDTYNLRRGGHGGFDYINANNLTTTAGQFKKGKTSELGKQGARALQLRKQTDLAFNNAYNNKISASLKSAYENGLVSSLTALNQTEEFQKKRKDSFKKNKHAQGERNSQFGTQWITDGTTNRKIKKDAVIPENWYKGRTNNFNIRPNAGN